MTAVSRRQIVRAAKVKGLTIQPDALELIEEYLAEQSGVGSAILTDLLAAIQPSVTSKCISAKCLESVFSDAGNDRNHRTSTKELVSSHQTLEYRVVSAFDQPQLVYEDVKKHFSVLHKQRSIFGMPKDKTDMMMQRYLMIQQRMLRHELFRPTDLHSKQMSLKLTPIESLLGLTNDYTSLVLGFLVQWEEGKYYLEDPSGQVLVDLKNVVASDYSFVTENCILIVEGYYHDDTFYAQRLGPPFLETRQDSLSIIQQHVTHEAYSQPLARNDANIVLLSNIHLDQDVVVQQLEGLLARYETGVAKGQTSTPLFCFMGSFSSDRRTFTQSALDELAQILLKHPKLCQHAHFVIIPSAKDHTGCVLPFFPLTSSHLWSRLAHVQFASNPCRIYWQGREMVLFCYNVLQLFAKQHFELKMADNVDADTGLSHRVVKTILDQSHLAPVAGMPIIWDLDYTMSLYPLPDVLVLGGDEKMTPSFTETYGDCQVVHCGSLSQGQYATYNSGKVHVSNKE